MTFWRTPRGEDKEGDGRGCRQCRMDPAGPDGFCSATCRDLWDRQMYDPLYDPEDEGGEA